MNPIVEKLSPGITKMIRMDHTHVVTLFHRFETDTPAARKKAIVESACLALDIHAQLEEEIFYPVLRTVLTGDPVLEKSEPEHEQMRQLIAVLRERGGDGSGEGTEFDDKFMELMRIVLHHVADEETRLLPAAERLLSDRLGELGIDMTKRRVQLLKPHAGELAASTVRSFPSAAAAGVLLTAGVVAAGAMLFSRRGRTRPFGASRPR